MSSLNKPKLIIIAGPNGSGKTTITEQGLGHEWFNGCTYINPDNIAQDELGDWNNASNSLEAAKRATTLRYDLLAKGKSIAFETVFSSEEKIHFIKQAKQQGYFIRLFFICTDSPMINASRIALRVMEGGHEVPISKIISRYQKSIINAYQSNNIVDRLYLYDNSVDDQSPQLMARFSDGELIKRYPCAQPSWTEIFLQH